MRSRYMNLGPTEAWNTYNYFWGNIPPGTVVKDPLGFAGNPTGNPEAGVDIRAGLKARHSAALKALTTTSGGGGTAGQAMVPVALDPLLVDQERRETPMREITQRIANLGITADWNERTSRERGKSYVELAALADNANVMDRYTKTIKYYYAIGRTSGPAQAAIPPGVFEQYSPTNYQSGKQLEVAMQTANLAHGEEIDMISGNPGGTYAAANTDTGYDADSVSATAMTGIKSQLSDENQDDQAGAAITVGDVEDLLNLTWEDGGKTSLMLTDGRTTTDLKQLMEQQTRYYGGTDLTWGFQTITFNGPRGPVPIVQSQFVRTDAGDGSGTIYGSKSILALDMQMIENRVLQDYTYEPLSKDGDYDRFMIKYYGCVIARGVNTTDATSFHGSIIDIA